MPVFFHTVTKRPRSSSRPSAGPWCGTCRSGSRRPPDAATRTVSMVHDVVDLGLAAYSFSRYASNAAGPTSGSMVFPIRNAIRRERRGFAGRIARLRGFSPRRPPSRIARSAAPDRVQAAEQAEAARVASRGTLERRRAAELTTQPFSSETSRRSYAHPNHGGQRVHMTAPREIPTTPRPLPGLTAMNKQCGITGFAARSTDAPARGSDAFSRGGDSRSASASRQRFLATCSRPAEAGSRSDPGRLVIVYDTWPRARPAQHSFGEHHDWESQSSTFAALSHRSPTSWSLTAREEPEQVQAASAARRRCRRFSASMQRSAFVELHGRRLEQQTRGRWYLTNGSSSSNTRLGPAGVPNSRSTSIDEPVPDASASCRRRSRTRRAKFLRAPGPASVRCEEPANHFLTSLWTGRAWRHTSRRRHQEIRALSTTLAGRLRRRHRMDVQSYSGDHCRRRGAGPLRVLMSASSSAVDCLRTKHRQSTARVRSGASP